MQYWDMKTLFTGFLMFFLLIAAFYPCMGGENPKKTGEKPFFTWDLLWTGSWYKGFKTSDSDLPQADDLFAGGTLYNRGDFRLNFERQELSLRFLATDKRILPPEEEDGKAGFHPGLGMYHFGSGSRLLFGVQTEYGLPARVRNIWLRSVPFMDSRSPSSRDLKTEPAAKDESESYLYLSLPGKILPGFDAFASVAMDREKNPALGTGLGLNVSGFDLRLEGFYTQKTLPPRSQSSWFSSSPALPERDFRLYSFGFIFSSPRAAFATDWAFSETFAWGRGTYGNFALRLGNKPWRFSLAGDGAGTRFTDRSGLATGAGFRLAAKSEHFRPRSGLFRFHGTFRSPSMEDEFDRGNISLYFRPSAPTAKERRENTFPVRFSRVSMDFNRDARKPEKTADTLNALLGFYLGPVSAAFSCSLRSLSDLSEFSGEGENQKSGQVLLLQTPFFENFDSFKVAWELRYSPGIFDFRTRLNHTIQEKKDPLWEFSLNCSVRPKKYGRVGLNIASTDFPEKWNYTLSWRLEKHS